MKITVQWPYRGQTTQLGVFFNGFNQNVKFSSPFQIKTLEERVPCIYVPRSVRFHGTLEFSTLDRGAHVASHEHGDPTLPSSSYLSVALIYSKLHAHTNLLLWATDIFSLWPPNLHLGVNCGDGKYDPPDSQIVEWQHSRRMCFVSDVCLFSFGRG